ncbi:hypothetical protein NA56DRAFT_652729 [Hyaloscypha hepaticicola]|uniref:Uncharacterized protein n=1 Tax=Hyaloscypha hepaticicola TaxID=2082293 RepID=A0A2J6PDK0_9HELO|nr:hypothetical protein NA56DRAFT_652729 [Hyaloscypha hepaticicola]
MDKLLSLLPIASKARTVPLAPSVAPALDEVLEYYRTYRPKNTVKNYKPK